jgi:hypothetical protein
MTTRGEIADQLAALADAEFKLQHKQVLDLPAGSQTVLLIEGCRVIDFHHVIHFISTKPEPAALRAYVAVAAPLDPSNPGRRAGSCRGDAAR